jgi:hypothetical protein
MATKTKKATTAKRNLRKIAKATCKKDDGTYTSFHLTPLPEHSMNLPKAPQLRTWSLPSVNLFD